MISRATKQSFGASFEDLEGKANQSLKRKAFRQKGGG